jgi:hypothetical protein
MNDNECLVYQMGKVGSVSLQVAIKDAGFKTLHAHYLYRTDGEYYTPKPKILRKIQTGEVSYKIITPVREPVARNVSAFFQGIHKYYADYKKMQYSQEVVDAFLNNYNHNWVLDWFPYEFSMVFPNVLRNRFNQRRGYQEYKARPHKIFILKLEYLDLIGFKPIAKFLGIRSYNTKIPHSNATARNERMKEFYDEFLEKAKFPLEYLDTMYNTWYATYFYTKKEIEEFKARWH